MKKDFKKAIYAVILIVFISLSFIVGSHHEYWADETQAWLIARDTSIIELFTKILHSDGHPGLWHLVIKFFQFLGLQIKYFYIIPIIFSSLGIAVFLFKSDYPIYLKIFLPFTYFIFYQYTVVTRGYCLSFLLLCLLATIWDKKFEKINLFTILFIILINSEAYIYMFCGALYIYIIYEFIKRRKEFDYKTFMKIFINLGIILLSFLITMLYMWPQSTSGVMPGIYFLSDSFLTNAIDTNALSKLLISCAIIIYFALIIYKENLKEFGKFVFFLSPVIIFFFLRYLNLWHLGLVLLMTIFIFWIQKRTNQKSIIIFLILICIVQIPWSVATSVQDYKNSYCQAENVANLIKQYDYKNITIVGIDFWCNSINAYFDENIFYKWNYSFFWLSKENPISDIVDITEEKYEIDYNYVAENQPEIVIKSNVCLDDNEMQNYNLYSFPGIMYAEGEIYGPASYYVYIRKDIDKNISISSLND